jgi:acyl carrier protein
VLAGIWAEVLKLDRVGVHDNFFELGGHSLLAMRLIARIRDGFGVELPLRSLFESPSVGEISAKLVQRQDAAARMTRHVEDRVAAMSFDQVHEMLQRLKAKKPL